MSRHTSSRTLLALSILLATVSLSAADLVDESLLATGLGRPGNLEAIDIDGDGDEDLAYATEFGPSAVGWLENLGGSPASFAPARVLHTVAAGARSLSVGDINGDGRPDLASAFVQGPASSTVLTWFQNVGGSPPSFIRRVIASGQGETTTALGDFDDDGDLDIYCSSIGGAHRWYSNGGGATPGFTRRDVGVGDGFDALAAGDLDGDGDIDIAVVNQFHEDVRWYENSGAAIPAFTERFVADATGFRASRLRLADLDGDGDSDLLTASVFGEARTVWFENLGGTPPRFAERRLSSRGSRAFAAFDADDDGDLDVVATEDGSSPPLSLFTNEDAAGEFTRGVLLDGALAHSDYAPLDMDGDGRLDLVVATNTDGGAVVWLESLADLLPVFIRETRRSFPEIRAAVDAASRGQTIVAEPAAFARLAETGRDLRFSSVADLDLSSFATVTGDTIFSAATGAHADVSASLQLLPGTRATIESRDLRFWSSSSVTLQVGSVLDARLEVFDTSWCGAELTLSENSSFVFDGQAVLGTRGTPPSFSERLATITAGYTRFAAADLDGDGRTDLVGARPDAGRIDWLRASGNPGTWLSPVALVTVATTPNWVVTADLDRDGDEDVVWLDPLADRVAWLENDGSATPSFTERTLLTTLDAPTSAAIADFDGNRAPDVVVVSEAASTVVWLQSDARQPPGFRSTVIARGRNVSGVRDVDTADLDADGQVDIVTAGATLGEIAWLQNIGSGRFTTILLETGLTGASAVRAGDLDDDGDIDLAVARENGPLEWLESSGGASPTVTRRRLAAAVGEQPAIDIGDIDGDGDVDLASTAPDDGVAWFENRGPVGGLDLLPLPPPATAGTRNAVLVADLDDETHADILVAGAQRSTWFRSATTERHTLVAAGATLAAAGRIGVGTIENERPLELHGGSIGASELINRSTLEGFGTVGADLVNEIAGSVSVVADLAVTGDVDNAGSIAIANGTLTVLGTLENSGTITGDDAVGVPAGDARGAIAGEAVSAIFAGGGWSVTAEATLALAPGARLATGGDFDCAIDDPGRFDLSRAELRLAGSGDDQTLEAMSTDIGTDPRALDLGFALGSLRIGPTAARVTVVDARDNDRRGQDVCEVVYADTVRVDAGATLFLPGCRVYFRDAVIAGSVVPPENLVRLVTSLPFERGDVNGDGVVDVADPVRLLLWLFAGAPEPGCLNAADSGDDDRIGLDDAVQLLDFLFRGGPSIAPPVGRCGEERAPGRLGCRASPCARGL